MKNILCILTNGFEELEALGTIALLRRASLNVKILSFPTINIKGSHNIEIKSDGLFNYNDINVNEYDLLLIAGGKQYVSLENNKEFINLILEFNKLNKYIAAICASPTILGRLNLLINKKYTCFSSMNDDFKGEYINTYVVKDQNIITSKSAASSIDFAFKIIETLLGSETCEKVKNSIYYYDK